MQNGAAAAEVILMADTLTARRPRFAMRSVMAVAFIRSHRRHFSKGACGG